MKKYTGFKDILENYKELPDSGWIGIKDDFSDREDIKTLNFYVPENIAEKIDIEDNYEEFLEAPTFKDIVSNKLEHHPKSTLDEILGAVVYYFNNDDFED